MQNASICQGLNMLTAFKNNTYICCEIWLGISPILCQHKFNNKELLFLTPSIIITWCNVYSPYLYSWWDDFSHFCFIHIGNNSRMKAPTYILAPIYSSQFLLHTCILISAKATFCWTLLGNKRGNIHLRLTHLSTQPSKGSFCVCTQPMRDDITLQHCLPLAGRIHKMIPASFSCLHESLNYQTLPTNWKCMALRNILITIT